MNCRFCKNELKYVFIDLGKTPPSNSYLNEWELKEPESNYPLKVFVCSNCFLVQVDEYKKANEIFDKEYAYFSSFSSSWLQHSKAYAEKMINHFGYNKHSLVIEIASNDGYLLQYFKEKGIPALGIEPSESTAKVAREKGIESITEFFGKEFAKKLVLEKGKADLLIGNNVLAHVPDINDFVSGLKLALKDNGIITIEFPHLKNIIINNQFDTIYHEHFSYLSFITVNKIFNAHDLEIFDVEEIPTHGGSLRIFAKHKKDVSKATENSVKLLLTAEHNLGIDSIKYYSGFQQKVNAIKDDFITFLIQCKKQNKKVAAYGAAAKGNTLLNYCEIKNNLISFVVDASPHKQGKYLPGSHIPIVQENKIKEEKPDFIIIFPWNIEKEITAQLSYINDWGGKFVKAIPHFQII